jgi:hypothetical protein
VERSLTVSLGSGAFGLLGLDPQAEETPRRLATAVAYYMAERDSSKPGWLYPEFRRDQERQAPLECTVLIDPGLWDRFVAEAERQDVSTDLLFEHAMIYLSAQEDSGDLARRLDRDIA